MPEIKKFLDQEGVRILWEAFKANYDSSISEEELLSILLKNALILQADWNEIDENSLSFIRNKPDISSDSSVGKNVTGQEFEVEIDDETETLVADEGAEIFNNYVKNVATGYMSHAEGDETKALEYAAHAEGECTVAKGEGSHAEGCWTIASEWGAHAEGADTIASEYGSHAEGSETRALEFAAHAEGSCNVALDFADHAEGSTTVAAGGASHAEGDCSVTLGYASHAENESAAVGDYSHSEGCEAIAVGDYSHAEGEGFTTYVGNEIVKISRYVYQLDREYDIAKDDIIIVNNVDNGVFGCARVKEYDPVNLTIEVDSVPGASADALDYDSWEYTTFYRGGAIGDYSHVEGKGTTAHGSYSHVQGIGTVAPQSNMDVIGKYNQYTFNYSIVPATVAIQNLYHIDSFSYLENDRVFIINNKSETGMTTSNYVIGDFYVSGNGVYEKDGILYSPSVYELKGKPEYYSNGYVSWYTALFDRYEFDEDGYGEYAQVVGNGEDDEHRSNAHTLDWEGNAWYQGDVYVGSTSGANKDDGSTKLATEEYVDNAIINISSGQETQVDWNQNDETASDYVKGRTHYVEKKVVEEARALANAPSAMDYFYESLYENRQSATYTFGDMTCYFYKDLEPGIDISPIFSAGWRIWNGVVEGSGFDVLINGDAATIQCPNASDTTKLVITIPVETEVVHKLDAKYIPDVTEKVSAISDNSIDVICGLLSVLTDEDGVILTDEDGSVFIFKE